MGEVEGGGEGLGESLCWGETARVEGVPRGSLAGPIKRMLAR